MFELMLVICLADSPINCSDIVDERTKYRTEGDCYSHAHDVVDEAVRFLYAHKLNERFYVERWVCRKPMKEAS